MFYFYNNTMPRAKATGILMNIEENISHITIVDDVYNDKHGTTEALYTGGT